MLHSGGERFLSFHETLHFVPHIFISLMLPVGDTKECSQAFILEHIYSRTPVFFLCQQAVSGLTSIEEGGGKQGFVELELGLETDVTLPFPS